MGSVSRAMDPRWNTAVDHLCKVWDALGPDRTLDALKVLASSDVTAEGLLVLEITAREGKREPLRAAAERAYAEGRIGPLPRMPSVRPESDYEMNLPEMPAPHEDAATGGDAA